MLLRLELRRSEAVCVELRRSGDVELERRLAWMRIGSNADFARCVPIVRSSKLNQFELGGLRGKSSALFMTPSSPRCLRVGFGFGFKGRGSVPGGIIEGSLSSSMEDLCSRGIALRYGSVIKGNASRLLIRWPNGDEPIFMEPRRCTRGVYVSTDEVSESLCCSMPLVGMANLLGL